MRILKVVHTFLPKYCAGTEVLVAELATELAKSHEVDILYTDPLSNNPDYGITEREFNGCHLWEIRKNLKREKKFEDSYIDVRVERIFEEVIQKLKPDVIHFHHLLYLSSGLPRIAKKYSIPAILTLHDFWFQCFTIKRVDLKGRICNQIDDNKCAVCIKRKSPLRFIAKSIMEFTKSYRLLTFLKGAYVYKEKCISKIFCDKKAGVIQKRNACLSEALACCNLILSPTKFLYDEFIKWGVPKEKILFSTDGIEDKYFKDVRKTAEDKFRFAFIGSLIPEKGLHILVKAFKQLHYDKAILDVYGSLNFNDSYVRDVVASATGVSGIVFKGGFPPETVGEIFRQIDCLVVPSTWLENSPLVIKDAILSRTPVIASHVPGVLDLLQDNYNALLFATGNVEELVAKMKQIMGRQECDKIVANIGKVKTVKENVDELIAIYNRLIGDK